VEIVTFRRNNNYFFN